MLGQCVYMQIPSLAEALIFKTSLVMLLSEIVTDIVHLAGFQGRVMV